MQDYFIRLSLTIYKLVSIPSHFNLAGDDHYQQQRQWRKCRSGSIWKYLDNWSRVPIQSWNSRNSLYFRRLLGFELVSGSPYRTYLEVSGSSFPKALSQFR